jgi:hypothetical protein
MDSSECKRMTKEMRNRVVVAGAALTIVTGVIALLFSNGALWAPGIFAAFFVSGGAHENVLGIGWLLSIAAAFNFLIYSTLSWVFLVLQTRIREENKKARS